MPLRKYSIHVRRVAVEHEFFQLPRWMSSIGHPRGTRHDPAMRHVGCACIQHGVSSMCDLHMGFAEQAFASVRYSRAYLVLDPTTVPTRRPAAFEQRPARGALCKCSLCRGMRNQRSDIRETTKRSRITWLDLITSHFVSLWYLQPLCSYRLRVAIFRVRLPPDWQTPASARHGMSATKAGGKTH